MELTVDDCVQSVVADVEAAGLGDVVLVAHSSGGLFTPGVATALANRVCHIVLDAASGNPVTLKTAMQLVRTGGTVIEAGMKDRLLDGGKELRRCAALQHEEVLMTAGHGEPRLARICFAKGAPVNRSCGLEK
jgi:pimeloyl-ACP methyl ester carboxylesterase